MRFLRPVVVVELVGTNKIPDQFLLFFFSVHAVFPFAV